MKSAPVAAMAKTMSEARRAGTALGEYTWPVLNQMAAVSMAATIVAYALYATSAENLPTITRCS